MKCAFAKTAIHFCDNLTVGHGENIHGRKNNSMAVNIPMSLVMYYPGVTRINKARMQMTIPHS